MTELLTALETARFLRCSLRTLDRERADGRGCPFVRIGGRIRYRRADVDAFVAAHVRGRATEAVPSPDTAQSRHRRLSKHAGRGGAAAAPPVTQGARAAPGGVAAHCTTVGVSRSNDGDGHRRMSGKREE